MLFLVAFFVAAIPFLQITSLHIAKIKAKQSFKSCVEGKLLDTLHLNASAYPNLKPLDEIYVGSNKYDIISVQDNNGSLFVVAVNDTAEKAIETWLRGHSHGSKNKLNVAKVPDWRTGFYFINQIYYQLHDGGYPHYSCNLTDRDLSVSSPPPEWV